jgi:hypothetical protein
MDSLIIIMIAIIVYILSNMIGKIICKAVYNRTSNNAATRK